MSPASLQLALFLRGSIAGDRSVTVLFFAFFPDFLGVTLRSFMGDFDMPIADELRLVVGMIDLEIRSKVECVNE